MALLEYSLSIDVEKADEDDTTLNMNSFIFQTKEGNYLTIGSANYDSWDLEDGEMDGTWVGLEYGVTAPDGTDLVELTEDDGISLIALLQGAKLVGFFFDEDGLVENGYDKDFIPTVTDANIYITFNDVTFHFLEDKLISEQELIEMRDAD